MLIRHWFIGVSFVALSCGPRREDTRHPAVCDPDTARAVTSISDQDLAAAASAARHIVRGRLHFTGAVAGNDGSQQSYVIVGELSHLRGDPASIDPRLREEFPLLEPVSVPGPLARLMCREGDTFVFLVDFPDAGSSAAPGHPPSVARVFGPNAVKLHAILGDHEKQRVAP